LKYSILKNLIYIGDWGLGIGDWGLGIGDWAQSPIPNPQSPIPNPHDIFLFYTVYFILKIQNNKFKYKIFVIIIYLIMTSQ